MTKLRCVVERITYQNAENGYSVMKVKVKGYDDLVTLVGNLLEVPAGSVLLCEGEWRVDKRYGQQFQCETWEEVMPATAYGIEKYLGSGLVKGIGPKFAKLIVGHFGTDTIEVIETDIERLYEVPGIGKKRVEKIRESWEKQKDIKNVMLFLQGFGVSTAYAAKIYRQYGKESIDKVKENPYRLADDIWGIGFKTADGIARKMGYEMNDERRLRSGLIYTLNQLADEGHCYAEEEQLIATARQLLEADEECIRNAMTHAIEAYVSTANCDFTDPLALYAIKMIQADLVDSYNGDMAKRDSMHNAQCLAGMAFSNALLGIVHSMAHKTGAAFADYGAHLIHGAANAMYLPKVIAFNAKDETAAKRYAVIADEMKLGGETTEEKVKLLIDYLRGMNDDLNIPHCIGHYGPDSYPAEQGFVPENVFLERLPEIAKNAIADACTGSNPRQPSQEEMEKLLKCCYYDTEVDF